MSLLGKRPRTQSQSLINRVENSYKYRKSEGRIYTARAAPNFDSRLIERFGRKAFVVRSDLDSPNFIPSEPGALSLFAGSRRWEKKIVKNGCPWVLCLDVKADPDHDLTQPDLRAQVELLISSGVVIAVGAGPPCSSMSIAVTPPIRTREVPCGKPDLLPPLRAKRRIGNLLANWSAAVYRLSACLDCAV